MCEKLRFAAFRARKAFLETRSASRKNIAVGGNEGSAFRGNRMVSGWRAELNSFMATPRMAFVGIALSGLCALPSGFAFAASPSEVLPVPAITIYPGDAIKDDWLVDREFPSATSAQSSYVSNRGTIIGKISRRTLLPGAPIPLNAVSAAKIVVNGAKVRIVFEEGALMIATYGAALQDGGVGDVISLRNLDTGSTVSGTIQADGSVRLSGG
jgi:flagella basal body P-ring formation protein FlgA